MPPNELKNIGKTVKNLRMQKKLSFEEVQSLTGIEVQKLIKIENGDYDFTLFEIQKLGQVLGFNIEVE